MACGSVMRIDILTLFPQMFEGVLNSSILKRAAQPQVIPASPAAELNSPSQRHSTSDIALDTTSDRQQQIASDDGPKFHNAEPAVSYHLTDIRQYTLDKHGKVDQRPFGGGPGMVIQCQPVWDAVRAVEVQDPRPVRRILMTPQGRRLDQRFVETLVQHPRLLIIAGHYEGIDERVIDKLDPIDEVSIGDYVLRRR